MIVIGIDAALCNTGIAAMRLTASGVSIIGTRVIRTEPSAKKRNVLAIEDDARRVGEITRALNGAVVTWRPTLLVVEATGAGKGSRAVRAMALAFGAVVAVAESHGLVLEQVSPLDVKRAVVGRKSAEKGEIVLEIERRFPDVPWPNDVPAGCYEHAADAIGAVLAADARGSDVIRLARRMSA